MVRFVCRRREQCAGRQFDAGFTLVELVVALTILAIGIVAVVGVTNSSFRVSVSGSARSKAIMVATKVIEEFRAVPYDELVVADGSGTTTTYTEVVNGKPYTIEKTLRWVAEGTVTKAYKEAIVAVRWSDAGNISEVNQSSYIYPGGIGNIHVAEVTSDTTSNCTPETPTSLNATRPLDTALQPSTIDLSWAFLNLLCPLEAFVIQYSTDNFANPREVTRDATAFSYRLGGLTHSTTYQFRVAARSASGRVSGWSNIATQSTTAATVPCTIGTITVTPSVVNKRNPQDSSGITVDPVLEVLVQGSCTGFRAVYRPTASTTREALLALTSGGWMVKLEGRNIPWDVGKRYIDVYDTSTTKQVGAVLLTVCEHNVKCG